MSDVSATTPNAAPVGDAGHSTAYDAVPYTSHAFPQSDPRRIFCIARIFGIAATAPAGARILEIGCASGGNIIPLAARMPKAKWVGIDASERQIAEAQRRTKAMKLSNITFLHADISQLDARLEPFDYILCHGVYSWVTPEVQASILNVCRELLTRNGVAFISYNTYPGWKNREILRDAMLFHTAQVKDPREKLSHGRGMVEFMRELTNPNSAFARVLEDESRIIQQGTDDYIFHDHLESDNHPCYFHDFAKRAERAGLAYLADTTLSTMFTEGLGPQMHQRLITASGGNQVMLEQYLDFTTNRTFRQSLLVRDDAAASINLTLSGAALSGFAYRSLIASRHDHTDGEGPTTFYSRTGATITTNDPDDRAALSILPGNAAMAWDAWCADVARATRQSVTEIAPKLETLLLRLVPNGLVELFDAPIASKPTRVLPPTADPVVRQLAADGTNSVANRFHETRILSPVQQIVLPSLDGTAKEDALREKLGNAVSDGKLFFWREGVPVTEPAAVQRMTGELLTAAIDQARRDGLLI